MLFFFDKKKYLVDYLEGFIDIHNHVLPGIDDGAKTVEDAIALLNGFSEIGITRFIATPHIMQNYYPNTRDSITTALNSLKEAMLQQNLRHISIEAAAEHMVDADFELLLETEGVMPIQKMYLLVEMSYLQPSLNFEEAISKVASKRLFPILAHPERYNFLKLNSSKYGKYKEKGILFQMNLLSLGTYYGKEVQKKVFHLLDEGVLDFAGSDIHTISQLSALKEITVRTKHLKQLLPIIEKTIQSFY